MIPSLKNLTVVLASESPRRLVLLKQIGLDPIVEVSGYDEKMDQITVSAAEFVKECSKGKAAAVAERLKQENRPFDVIIGCDTVIEFEGKIIGKPKDDADAIKTLKMLSGNTHNCLTGLTLIDSKFNELTSVTQTEVVFANISDEVLQKYIELGEHRGCAGSYRIQGSAAAFIRSINGCFNNVVGLPIQVLCEQMQQMLK
ncbi:hypothetical protein M3Y97_00391200 [Aphelenchoides bicaudatus]|nr:hypothetical protein M3Y97_00391200 [Aphelenchoides bicaudatus]